MDFHLAAQRIFKSYNTKGINLNEKFQNFREKFEI